MEQVALGKRIKAARERVGMTQEELAAAVDYSVDHVSVVERGVKPFERGDDAPSHGTLRAFEDALPGRAA